MTIRPSPSPAHTIVFLSLVLALAIVPLGAGAAELQEKVPPPFRAAPGLWIANGAMGYGTTFASEFQGARLSHSGKPRPNFGFFSDESLGQFGAIAFDGFDNLWTSYCAAHNGGPGSVAAITPAAVERLLVRHRTPFSVYISDPAGGPYYFDCPKRIVFDASGNLWVANSGATRQDPSILKFTPEQLKQSGSPTPTIKLTSTEQDLAPHDLAFDASGNLWVAGSTGDPQPKWAVSKFTPAQLQAGGSQIPSASLRTTIFSNPSAITFDGGGNLWVAYFAGGTSNLGGLLMFAASSITGTGPIFPSPAVEIDPTPDARFPNFYTMGCPGSVALDPKMNLWVTNFCPSVAAVIKFSPSEIQTSGNPKPSVLWQENLPESNLHAPGLLTFGPSVR